MWRFRAVNKAAVAAALLLLGATSGAEDMPGCSCSRADILRSIKTANTVFYGGIVKASMDSKDAGHIRIWAEPRQPIRGVHDKAVPIVTTRLQACGVPARIGNHYLFVIPRRDAVVTRCTGTALPWDGEWRELLYALVAVEFSETNRAYVDQWVGRMDNRRSRDEMQSFFDLIDALDPDYAVHYEADRVTYRSMTWVFSESGFTIEWSQ